MLIQDISRQASIELLKRTRLGRLACVHDGQPYITPVTFACDENYLYAFSTIGQKITWMRANPRVCVEADELVTRQDWATVIVIGRYEELTDGDEYEVLRHHAYNLLRINPVWWEPGYVETVVRGTTRPLGKPLYFRIHMDQISGHRGVPDMSARQRPSGTPHSQSWLERILRGRKLHSDNRDSE